MKYRQLMFAVVVALSARLSPLLAGSLADMAPEGTVLYLAWPGADALGEAIKDTEFSKMLAEPQVQHFREMFREKVWKFAHDKMKEESAKEGGPSAEAFEPAMTLLEAVWRHPALVSLIGVAPGAGLPKIDAMVMIRGGDQAGSILGAIDKLLQIAVKEAKLPPVQEVEIAAAKWKQITVPNGPSLRYGQHGNDVLVLIGEQVLDLLQAGDSAKTLAKSNRFQAAMKAIGGSDTSPVFYLDARTVVKTLDKFAPMLAAMQVPVISEPNGAQNVLTAVGLGGLESISAAMTPEQAGFKTSVFIHAPGVGKDASAVLSQKSLTDDDLRIVPKDAVWATVANLDLLSLYKGVLGSVEKLSPQAASQANSTIQGLEQSLGFKVEDVLRSMGDTWSLFDAPSNGSLFVTGITLVTEAKPGNKLGEAMQALAGLCAGLADAGKQVSVKEETYRGAMIHYVNVAALPFPVAPAWAQQGDHWILALYPQMVRIAIDRMIDKTESILDNADFQHGRKVMPAQVGSIRYADSRAGVQSLYAIMVPVAQALIGMGQGEGMQIDATMMPALPSIMRHLFGEVSASTATPEGYLSVSYGCVPVGLGGFSGSSGSVAGTALMASIMLPSLAQREVAKRTVSMANLRQVGIATQLYANDNDNKVPASLKVLIEKGMIEEKTLKSPLAEGDEDSYVYVGADLSNPRHVIAYEKPEHHHGEGTVVLYADGHVEFLDMERFEKDLKATQQGVKKKD